MFDGVSRVPKVWPAAMTERQGFGRVTLADEYREKWAYIRHTETIRLKVLQGFYVLVAALLALYSDNGPPALPMAVIVMLLILACLAPQYLVGQKKIYNKYVARVRQITGELERPVEAARSLGGPFQTIFVAIVFLGAGVIWVFVYSFPLGREARWPAATVVSLAFVLYWAMRGRGLDSPPMMEEGVKLWETRVAANQAGVDARWVFREASERVEAVGIVVTRLLSIGGQAIEEAIARGVRVEVLMLDPNSEMAAARGTEMKVDTPGNVRRSTKAWLRWRQDLSPKLRTRVRVAWYRQPPYMELIAIDRGTPSAQMVVTPTLVAQDTDQSPTILVPPGHAMEAAYVACLESYRENLIVIDDGWLDTEEARSA